ncbi:MAG: hypothetical protein MJ090_01455 [Clostridia bacterium]|nr:hypothetical protein [Clostridia bacterium]
MKKILQKTADVIKVIFGYGIMICLLTGGLTFFGYLAAVFIGGSTAEMICDVIYNHIYPVLVIISTSMILLGLIRMYIVGESDFSSK